MFSQLHHPNIVHFYGAGVPPNLFYVMELCQRSLFDLLHHCRRSLCKNERVKMAVRRQEEDAHKSVIHTYHRGMESSKNIVGNENRVNTSGVGVELEPILAGSMTQDFSTSISLLRKGGQEPRTTCCTIFIHAGVQLEWLHAPHCEHRFASNPLSHPCLSFSFLIFCAAPTSLQRAQPPFLCSQKALSTM